MREFFSTDGRLNRGRFALQYFSFFLSAVLLASGSSVYVGTTNSQSFILGLFALVVYLLFGFLLITRTIKRFHDLGHSGWWTLATLIPLVGFTVLIYLLFWRGTVGANEYGPDPLQAAGTHAEPQSPATATPSSSPQSYNSPTKAGPASADSADFVTPNINEQFWATALVEFESDARRPGVWAKSYAETNGNEAAAKAAYLRYRAKELIDEHRREDQPDEDRFMQHEVEQKGRLTERELEHESGLVGHCPNCKKIIPAGSPTCPDCYPIVENTAWKVKPLTIVLASTGIAALLVILSATNSVSRKPGIIHDGEANSPPIVEPIAFPQGSAVSDAPLNAQGVPLTATKNPDGTFRVERQTAAPTAKASTMTLDTFDWGKARAAGYDDSQILDGLNKSGMLSFDLNRARLQGYGDTEIADYFANPKPKPVPKSTTQKPAPLAPNLAGLSREETSSLESACFTDKYRNGPAAYNKCRAEQLAKLRRP